MLSSFAETLQLFCSNENCVIYYVLTVEKELTMCNYTSVLVSYVTCTMYMVVQKSDALQNRE